MYLYFLRFFIFFRKCTKFTFPIDAISHVLPAFELSATLTTEHSVTLIVVVILLVLVVVTHANSVDRRG